MLSRAWNFLNQCVGHQCLLCLTKTKPWPLCEDCIRNLPWIDRAKTCRGCGLPLVSDKSSQSLSLSQSVDPSPMRVRVGAECSRDRSVYEIHDGDENHEDNNPEKVSVDGLCGPCRIFSLPFDSVQALFAYEWPCDRFIAQIKFNQKLALINFFGSLMAKNMIDLKNRPTCLIPVPLHLSRLQERGFNQSYLLAKSVSKIVNIPVEWDLLQKTKITPTQAGLSALSRTENLNNAFIIKKPFPARYRSKVVLIDDVMTTGTTVEVLTKLLKAAGVRSVDVWCCCRTLKT